jgi:hypothetical protein
LVGRGRLGCAHRQRARFLGAQGLQQSAGAQQLTACLGGLLAHVAVVGAGGGGVQLHQQLAGSHPVPVLHEDAAHHAGLQRLDELGAFAHHDAPGRYGHDVDLAQQGPGQRDEK